MVFSKTDLPMPLGSRRRTSLPGSTHIEMFWCSVTAFFAKPVERFWS